MLVVWLQITLHFFQFILINQSAGFVYSDVEAGISRVTIQKNSSNDEVCWTCLLERESIL